MNFFKSLSIAVVFLFHFIGNAQYETKNSIYDYFEKIEIRIDTLVFSSSTDLLLIKGEKKLPFHYARENQIAEIRLYPLEKETVSKLNWSVASYANARILDSMVFLENAYYSFRIQFEELSSSDFQRLLFSFTKNASKTHFALHFFPVATTKVQFYAESDELFIGEEKRFELVGYALSNLKLSGEWVKQGDFDYRFFERNGTPYIAIIPNALGAKTFQFQVETKKPVLNDKKNYVYSLVSQKYDFTVRGSRLSFLKVDEREIIKESSMREGIEIQLDNHRNLQVHKTYRIEDREEGGGPLIAEIYTVRRLSNDKMLCIIRPYLLHQARKGYLFIKDGDEPKFITNVDILPEMKIYKVSMLKAGKSWSSDLTVFPGETVDVKVEGEGLKNGKFYLEAVSEWIEDSIISSNEVLSFRCKIPTDIKKRYLDIYHKSKKTGFFLPVAEFQRPRELDFVLINYGDGFKKANDLSQTILYGHTIKDVTIKFNTAAIDEAVAFYGKQFLEIDVRITGKRDELIEFQKIEYLEVCPTGSVRSLFYEGGNCVQQDVSLNAYLSRKTHSLDPWSKIELTIRHKRDKYNGQGFVQKIEIYCQKLVTFDVDVSFPAGLVIKKIGVDGFPGLGGISLAMLAQFSFYEKDKVRRLRPYKVGAGFLAQNAFNFSPEAQDRDLGIVVLGSVYPTRKDSKLSFPLYAGFGYFLNQDKFFYLIGPGIRINL
jgi:hypothetical protein